MNDFHRLEVSFWGLPSAAGALVCLLTVTAFFGRVWWVFDLTSHFRVQYAIALLLLSAAFCLARKYWPAFAFAGFAAVNLAIILPYCFFGRAPVGEVRTTLRLMLVNVQTENQRHDLVKALIEEQKPDVIVMEEVNDEWMTKLADLKTSHPHVCRQPRDDNFGIVLFSRLPLDHAEIIYLGDSELPSVMAEIKVGSRMVRILGTHPLPPAGGKNTRLRDQQLKAVPGVLAGWSGSVILLGDLNTTPWSHTFRTLLRETSLLDSGCGAGLQTTCPSRFFPLRIGIDHCLLSRDLGMISRSVGTHIGYDHLPLLVEIAIE